MAKKAKKKAGLKKKPAKKPAKKIVKKKAVKKAVGKKKAVKAVAKTPAPPAMKVKPLGKVTHYYDRIGVAVVALEGELKIGDKIKIGKNDRWFEQTVKSMQMEHKPLEKARKGQEIGMKVAKEVRPGYLMVKA